MLKKLFLAILLLVAAGIGALFLLWRQAARLPDWYDPGAEAPAAVEQSLTDPAAGTGSGPETVPGPAVAPSDQAREAPAASSEDGAQVAVDRDLRRQLRQEAARSGTLRIDQGELNALLQRALRSDPDGRRVHGATRAVRATLEGERLIIGAVTDLDRLNAAARDAEERAAIGKLRRLAPWIAGRDFYLGVEGRPRARDGELTFDGVTVNVGRLSFDPTQLLSLVGLPADRLDRELAVRLPDAELEDVRIEGDVLVLSLAEGRSH